MNGAPLLITQVATTIVKIKGIVLTLVTIPRAINSVHTDSAPADKMRPSSGPIPTGSGKSQLPRRMFEIFGIPWAMKTDRLNPVRNSSRPTSLSLSAR